MITRILYFFVVLQFSRSLPPGAELKLVRLVTKTGEVTGAAGEAGTQCLEDGNYCWEPEECCTGGYHNHSYESYQPLSCDEGECSHHWPPTTTPVFGQCGAAPECQARYNKYNNHTLYLYFCS